MGHEFIGVVDAVGSDVATVKAGDLVVSPFLWSDGSCVFCREGLQSECLHGGRYGFADVDGGRGKPSASLRPTERLLRCLSKPTTR
jgi:threonine dehydrogenase-like Zn-dependent dehydrogenase